MLQEKLGDILGKISEGDVLSREDLEALRPSEEDSRELFLVKNVLLNRYLLLQQQSVIIRLLEGQAMQTEELERLTDAEELPLGERLRMVEEHSRLEDMDEAAMERLRDVLLGT